MEYLQHKKQEEVLVSLPIGLCESLKLKTKRKSFKINIIFLRTLGNEVK